MLLKEMQAQYCTVEGGQRHVSYRLCAEDAAETVFRRTMYAIAVSDGETSALVPALTSVRAFAEGVLRLLCGGVVTPCTLQDVLYDLAP